MTRTRLITLLLTFAFALAAAPAVMAQEEEGSTFDPASIPEVNQDEALILYLVWRQHMLAAGVAADDLGSAATWFEGEAANLSPGDVEELLTGQMLAESDAELGDDEMGDDEEEEEDGE